MRLSKVSEGVIRSTVLVDPAGKVAYHWPKVSAACVGLEAKIGTLEVGKFADIIAVKEDPLAKISALKNVVFVMKEGTIYKDETRSLLA